MRHALMYVGGFERNFPTLTAATSSFTGTDGKEHTYLAWPPSADGLRVGYMEKHGKKFVAVRVGDGVEDVALKNELVMVPGSTSASALACQASPRSSKTTTRS
jgi:hypothetical protein